MRTVEIGKLSVSYNPTFKKLDIDFIDEQGTIHNALMFDETPSDVDDLQFLIHTLGLAMNDMTYCECEAEDEQDR